MENEIVEPAVSRRMRNEKHGRKSRKTGQDSERSVRLMRIAIYVLITAIFVSGAALFYGWVKTKSEPPKSYYDLQVRKWQDLVNKNQNDIGAHLNLGLIHYKEGNDRAAYREFNRAVELNKKDPAAHYYLGMLDKREGRPDEAVLKLSEALKLSNGRNKFLPSMSLGEIYEKKKNLNKAARYYEIAVETNDMYWNANLALAKVYEKLGKKDEALKQYRAAARFNPDDKDLQTAIKRLSNKSKNK